MALELVVGRIAATYVGWSLYTWTAIISIVMLGISLGSWLGGRLADRWSSPRLLAVLLIVGGLLSWSVLLVDIIDAVAQVEKLAQANLSRETRFAQLQTVAHAAVDLVDDLAVLLQKNAGPPVNRHVAGMVLLHRTQQQRAIAPGAARLRGAVMFVLQDHRQLRPERLGQFRVEPRARRRLHADAVVPQRHAFR